MAFAGEDVFLHVPLSFHAEPNYVLDKEICLISLDRPANAAIREHIPQDFTVRHLFRL